MEYIDLHTHTNYSDGRLTPAELITYAVEKSLCAIAVTDHDTVKGIREAEQAAKNQPIEVIPAIEITAGLGEHEVHIVGLFIDIENRKLLAMLDEVIQEKEQRNIRLIDTLEKAGCPASLEEMNKHHPGVTLSAMHFARHMMDVGFVSTVEEGLSIYLRKGGKFYSEIKRVNAKRAVETILESGGIPVLAHPFQYASDIDKLSEILGQLKGMGLKAVEVLYPTHTPEQEKQIKQLAGHHKLKWSGGSDFHGSNKPHIDLGVGCGDLKVPYEVLKDLKEEL